MTSPKKFFKIGPTAGKGKRNSKNGRLAETTCEKRKLSEKKKDFSIHFPEKFRLQNGKIVIG